MSEGDNIFKIIYIVIAIFVFGLLIFIHELGHFLAARACGVGVKEFAIGMGPKLVSWKSKKYDTVFRLRLFPIGGFVSMVGEEEESECDNAFCNKSIFKRIFIVLAGPVMNIILGFLLMIILVIGQKTLLSTTIYQFDDNALSSQYLQVEDKIVKVGKTRVYTFYDVVNEIMNQGYEPVDITVIRSGERITLEDVTFPVIVQQGVEFGQYDFVPYLDRETPINYVKHAITRSLGTVKMVVDSIVDLVNGRYGLQALSGPVGVTEVIVDAAQNGFYTLLYIVIVLSINLGVFNLIPFPILDGGRLLFLAIEGVRGKPINKDAENYINTVAMIIMLGFMVFIIFKDVFGILGGS